LERIGGEEKKIMTRTNHLGALAAAAGALVAVGLLVLMMVVVEVRPARATFPGQNGKIAYWVFDPDREIYTINAGGGGKVQVTNNTTADSDPSYSPSGKKIAYQGDDGPADDEIYTINAGGGGRSNVTNNTTDDFEPSWGSRP
jgi:WD40 repeat protein